MVKRRKKLPKYEVRGDKEVRIQKQPTDHETLTWRFSILDWDGPWGIDACRKAKIDFRELIEDTLSHLETMTWAEIYQARGGRRHGNNNHPVKIEDLAAKARKRLAEINQDDIDCIVSIRIDSKRRIYGIRDGRALKILWLDLQHAIYPSNRRHT